MRAGFVEQQKKEIYLKLVGPIKLLLKWTKDLRAYIDRGKSVVNLACNMDLIY